MRRLPRGRSGTISDEFRERTSRAFNGGAQRHVFHAWPRERLRYRDFQSPSEHGFRRRAELTRLGSLVLPMERTEIYDGACVLKLVKGDPQRFTSEHTAATSFKYIFRIDDCSREYRWIIPVAPGIAHGCALVPGRWWRCCCLSLFAIVRTGRPVPRQEIVKVMYGHVARYVSTLDAYTIESLYPFEFWDIMRIVRVHPP